MSYHFSKFDGHSHSGGEVKMILVYIVISQDHLIKVPNNLMCGSPSWEVTTLPSLVAIGIAGVEI